MFINIAVVGAGAIGCYVGGMLARAGMNVVLIGRRRHVEPISRNGLLLQSQAFEQRIALAATEDISAVRHADLVLFCVKSNDTDEAAGKIAPYLARNAVILSLQNGVDNVERIRRHVQNVAIPVLVYAAAEMTAPGCVKHTGGGRLIIGWLSACGESDPDAMAETTALFARAKIPTTISDHVEVELWSKLAINCAYNAVSALGGAPYRRMVAMPEVRTVMLAALKEAADVARAGGIELRETIVDDAMKVADMMPDTISSTAQDILNKRPTEIEHLNGYVVREGERLGIATPVNRTLTALVKLLEQTRLQGRTTP